MGIRLLCSQILESDKLEADPLMRILGGSDEYRDDCNDCNLTFSSDGLRLAIASLNKVDIYCTKSGDRQRQLLMEMQSRTIIPDTTNVDDDNRSRSAKIACATFSHDGTKVAFAIVGYPKCTLFLWEIDNKSPSEQLDVDLEIRALAFSSTGLLAAIAINDNFATKKLEAGPVKILYKTAPLEELDRISLGQPEQQAFEISFSHDSSSLITNRGLIDIDHLSKPPHLSKGLTVGESWISRGGGGTDDKWILLPSDYLQTCSDFRNELFVFGNYSGRVTILDSKDSNAS